MTKIISLDQLLFYVVCFKQLNKKLVLATGCFDLLHLAHRQFLQRAKKEGDILIIGLESDKRVRQLKGKDRPVNPWPVRAGNLAKLKPVDLIFYLPTDIGLPERQLALIKKIRPEVLAVSGHTYHLLKKKALMERFGGKLKIVMKYNPRFSTSKLLSVRRKVGKKN